MPAYPVLSPAAGYRTCFRSEQDMFHFAAVTAPTGQRKLFSTGSGDGIKSLLLELVGAFQRGAASFEGGDPSEIPLLLDLAAEEDGRPVELYAPLEGAHTLVVAETYCFRGRKPAQSLYIKDYALAQKVAAQIAGGMLDVEHLQ